MSAVARRTIGRRGLSTLIPPKIASPSVSPMSIGNPPIDAITQCPRTSETSLNLLWADIATIEPYAESVHG
ncbi:MAG: hypothetical protein Q9183_002014 [Haloplaca sp. 2 TL-2023]